MTSIGQRVKEIGMSFIEPWVRSKNKHACLAHQVLILLKSIHVVTDAM